MTREEEIRQEALLRYPYEGGTKGMICEENRRTFEDGAKWSDEHPKSPWISVSERLSEEHKYESDTMRGHKEWTESECEIDSLREQVKELKERNKNLIDRACAWLVAHEYFGDMDSDGAKGLRKAINE